MGEKLFNEKIIELINLLTETKLDSIGLRNELINFVPTLAEELQIGKLTVNYNIPISIYNRTLKKETIVFYDEGVYEETNISQKIDTKYEGSITIVVNCKKNCTWDEKTIVQIKNLNWLIFFIYSHKKQEEVIDEASMTDILTGAPNTAKLMQFGSKIEDIKKYVAIFCNIKNFKYVNQQVGMRIGNEILSKFYNTVKSFLNDDEIIVRTGGDNFAGLIKKERIYDFISYMNVIDIIQEFQGQNRKFEIETRMGIHFINNNEPFMANIEKANIAMNFIKDKKSENVFIFDDMLEKRMIHKKNIMNSFKEGIKNNEFLVFYQPKVNTKNNTLFGCEALVRWKQNGAFLPPDSFIPILEKEGNICALDFYVLKKVLEDISLWIEKGITPVKVSINFSKKHLLNKHIAKDIINMVNRYNVPKEYIEIEITESACIDCFDELVDLINNLRKNGINVSIDDFGTGYSSLSLLKNISVDTIKIDKSFIDNIFQDKKDEIILKNIIHLIKELGFNIVVEGVENKEQVNFLSENGCNIIQGYYFDKALPPEIFENKLLNKIYNN